MSRLQGDPGISLLDPQVEKPRRSRAVAFTIVALVLVAATVLWFSFRYYPEKKAATQFFDALVAGNTTKAYELWQPSATYRMSDFLADWGTDGYYGPVRSFRVLDAEAPRNGSSISVNVAISPFSPMPSPSDADKSRKTRVVTLWVLPKDKSLSFPP
ncbi:MAG TPA: hypothetical protein VL128_05385 [Candidatus Eisenbacteria bacterium]|nr:hypothetical protein [Candidatus Eisenbacteria bacterium]